VRRARCGGHDSRLRAATDIGVETGGEQSFAAPQTNGVDGQSLYFAKLTLRVGVNILRVASCCPTDATKTTLMDERIAVD